MNTELEIIKITHEENLSAEVIKQNYEFNTEVLFDQNLHKNISDVLTYIHIGCAYLAKLHLLESIKRIDYLMGDQK